jgi:NAD(P)-dependent dehydrogenase (short-subunit alcohol dehydrogenase family)
MTDPTQSTLESSAAHPQPFRLDGRHALVTGGASGIGEATVKELVRAGAFVWIADIDIAAAEALAESTGSAKALHLDVTSPASISAALAHVDRLDILVNNAGIGHVGSIETTEPEDFDRLLSVNVRGVYLVTRAFLPRLFYPSPEEDEGMTVVGAIVNIASVSGLVGIKQRFCPGTVQSPFVEGYLDKFHKHNKEEMRAEIRARQPIGRLGKPKEIASMVRYLASDEAAFITGSIFTIDGGWTAA